MIRYARAPSPALLALLAPGGLLSQLLTRRGAANLQFDVHFREGDKIHVYCGLTRPIEVQLVREVQPNASFVANVWAEGADLYLGGHLKLQHSRLQPRQL